MSIKEDKRYELRRRFGDSSRRETELGSQFLKLIGMPSSILSGEHYPFNPC